MSIIKFTTLKSILTTLNVQPKTYSYWLVTRKDYILTCIANIIEGELN